MTFATLAYREDHRGKNKVIVKFVGSPDDSMDEYLMQLDAIYKKKQKFYLLYDASHIGGITYTQVNKQAAFMRERDQDTRELVIKCAIVLTSDIARMMLDGLFVLKKPACPLQVFRTMEEAKDFLREE